MSPRALHSGGDEDGAGLGGALNVGFDLAAIGAESALRVRVVGFGAAAMRPRDRHLS
jgi:hypothetical protein